MCAIATATPVMAGDRLMRHRSVRVAAGGAVVIALFAGLVVD